MATIHDHRFSLAFGLLGNILSFLVFLAPLPTFYRIFKKKSTEGFQSIPYSIALLRAMLFLYYAFLKEHGAFMLITINSIGCFIESLYLFIYMIYATKSARIFTAGLLICFNIGALGLIIMMTSIFSKGSLRVSIVGWICAVSSLCVFAAPLGIIRLVVRTKSVEYMPFSLSFLLTLCAVSWFLYGFSSRDYYIAIPNIVGFGFGIIQIILYLLYHGRMKEIILSELKPSADIIHVNVSTVNLPNNQKASMNNLMMIGKSQMVSTQLDV